jgi:hypothetical protein
MTKYQPDFISHYYRKGTQPFQSLSTLNDGEAVEIMRSLYDETMFGVRFKEPGQYLQKRRCSEKWIREEFKLKGGCPILEYPIYFVLGESQWLTAHSPDRSLQKEVRIKLADLEEEDVSFTYPDSMISFWLGNERPPELYLPEFHGKVFTRKEILAIVDQHGDPERDWHVHLPPSLAPYIEAQVWNKNPLMRNTEKISALKND